MLKLRKWMTEILLDVTSEEVDSVAREAYEEEQNKIRFIFKEPKFKPKRPKPNNILGTSERNLCLVLNCLTVKCIQQRDSQSFLYSLKSCAGQKS